MSLYIQLHCISILVIFLLVPAVSSVSSSESHSVSAKEPYKTTSRRLSRHLTGEDGLVYACSGREFFAFHSNGSIVWTVLLNYTCNVGIAPVQGGSRKIYLVAENRVLKINPLNIGTSESAVDVFFGPEPDGELPGDIIGIAVSISSSCVLINVKNRGLFAYRLHGQLRWSAGPVLYQHGYRQGCRKIVAGCFFTSGPVIDHCEASIYISNSNGELYSLSVRTPNFKWIRDLSAFDNIFTVTPGNNGQLYVTLPARALILALDVSTGNILWQGSIGPLSSADIEPVIDSNGWISIGSLDGFLYSFSPTGSPKKYANLGILNSVIQVSPVLDCSGYAVYISMTGMEGKSSRTIEEYIYVSAMKPESIMFTVLVPASGFIYWAGNYSDEFFSKIFQSDLQHFVLDERILLAFVAASRIGNLLPCRTIRQKLAASCSQVALKNISIYTGNERTIILFLLFESVVLLALAAVVRYCCVFWKKKKLQILDLGEFLEKRRSLRLQKKVYDRTITDLKLKASEDAKDNEVLEKLSDLVKQREGIKRKLSTTYSLGRDEAKSRTKSLLPLYGRKTRSFSFQGGKKESVTIFHRLSDTSSGEEDNSRSEEETTDEEDLEDKELAMKTKGKGPIEVVDEIYEEEEYMADLSDLASSSRGL